MKEYTMERKEIYLKKRYEFIEMFFDGKYCITVYLVSGNPKIKGDIKREWITETERDDYDDALNVVFNVIYAIERRSLINPL